MCVVNESSGTSGGMDCKSILVVENKFEAYKLIWYIYVHLIKAVADIYFYCAHDIKSIILEGARDLRV